jgi:hypothetical protein
MYLYVVGKLGLPWPPTPDRPNGLKCGDRLTGEDAKAFEAKPHLSHLATRHLDPDYVAPKDAAPKDAAAKPASPAPSAAAAASAAVDGVK